MFEQLGPEASTSTAVPLPVSGEVRGVGGGGGRVSGGGSRLSGVSASKRASSARTESDSNRDSDSDSDSDSNNSRGSGRGSRDSTSSEANKEGVLLAGQQGEGEGGAETKQTTRRLLGRRKKPS